MEKNVWVKVFGLVGLLFFWLSSGASASESAGGVNEARLVAQYNYSIHILAMLVVGFGFLMVFVKRYGFGATTGTYLVVAAGLPLYMFLRANGIIGHAVKAQTVEALMLADLCPNVYLDTSSSNRWMRYHAPHLDLRAVFRQALEVAGPKRLLFGSDSSFFPRGWHYQIFEEQATALYELGLDEAGARAIFRENLMRILAA